MEQYRALSDEQLNQFLERVREGEEDAVLIEEGEVAVTTPLIRRATADDAAGTLELAPQLLEDVGQQADAPGVVLAGQDRRIARLVKEGVVLVAYFPEVPDEVLGWACLSGRRSTMST